MFISPIDLISWFPVLFHALALTLRPFLTLFATHATYHRKRILRKAINRRSAIDRGARAQIKRHVKTMVATAAGAIVQPPASYRQTRLIYTNGPTYNFRENNLSNGQAPISSLCCQVQILGELSASYCLYAMLLVSHNHSFLKSRVDCHCSITGAGEIHMLHGRFHWHVYGAHVPHGNDLLLYVTL